MAKSKKLMPPTKEELATLPRWARVAFAARCARRVQPLFKHHWPDAPEKHIIAIDEVITLAEKGAYNANAYVASVNAAADADAYSAAWSKAAYIDISATAAVAKTAYAAFATSHAIIIADDDAAATAADAAASAVANANVAAPFPMCWEASVLRAIRRDFELLVAAAKDEHWNAESRVPPPAFFGPVWPEGPPEGWPTVEQDSSGCQLVVDLVAPEGATEEEICKLVEETALRLSAVHRAYGGNGLKIDNVDICGPVLAREEVLS